jgi:methionyl aminopeptidase
VSTGDIEIYNKDDLEGMKKAGKLANSVLLFIEQYIAKGVSTEEIDKLCHDYIISHDATPSPLNYNGYPKSICTSVNEVVCHGIPNHYKLKDGDIINIDVTIELDGWHGDTSKTFMVGECTRLAKELVSVTEKAMYVGIEAVKPFGYFGDIGNAIQNFVDRYGFSIVRDYCGHGIGRTMHESPSVIHYATLSTGPQILPGMFFTIEPMINVGTYKTKLLKNGWTAVTVDKSLSSQFEHTIAVTENSVEILTL